MTPYTKKSFIDFVHWLVESIVIRRVAEEVALKLALRERLCGFGVALIGRGMIPRREVPAIRLGFVTGLRTEARPRENELSL